MTEADEKQQLRDSTNFVQIYVLSVTVIEAKDLRAADLNGKSDPYVKCRVLGANKRELSTFETEVIEKNNKNPTWNKFHVFSFFDRPLSIIFEIWDKDESTLAGKDDELGQTTINLNSLFDSNDSESVKKQISQLSDINQINEKWYKLGKIKKHKAKGCVKLSIKAERLFPMQTERRLRDMVNELEMTKNEKMEQEKTLNGKIKELEGVVSKMVMREQELEKKQSELEGQLKNKAQENEELSKKQSNLEKEIIELKAKIDTNGQRIRSMTGEYNELQSNYDKLNNEKTELINSANNASNENNNLKDEMEREIANKNSTIEELNTRVRELETQVANANINANMSGATGGGDEATARLLKDQKDDGKEKTGCTCCVM